MADIDKILTVIYEQAIFEHNHKQALKPLVKDVKDWRDQMTEKEKKVFEESLASAKECEDDQAAHEHRKQLMQYFNDAFKSFDVVEDGLLDRKNFR